MMPHQLVDGLEVKLVQAGHPYGLDLARLLAIKSCCHSARRSC